MISDFLYASLNWPKRKGSETVTQKQQINPSYLEWKKKTFQDTQEPVRYRSFEIYEWKQMKKRLNWKDNNNEY